MVIEERQRQPYRSTEPKKKRDSHPMSVLGVQCLACVAAVLLALLLRFVGGGAYAEVRRNFRDTLYRNDLMAVLASLWEDVAEDGLPMESDVSVPNDA